MEVMPRKITFFIKPNAGYATSYSLIVLKKEWLESIMFLEIIQYMFAVTLPVLTIRVVIVTLIRYWQMSAKPVEIENSHTP